MTNDNHLIFVYGTLKRGIHNHSLLADSIYHGEGQTVEKFRMLLPSFPVILPDENGYPVKGELYQVDDEVLHRLDRLEGEGYVYHRKPVTIQLSNSEIAAEIYIGDDVLWAHRNYDIEEPEGTPPTLTFHSPWDKSD